MINKHIIKLGFVFAVVFYMTFIFPISTNAAEKNISCVEYKNLKSADILKSGKTYKITKKGFDHGYLRFKASKTKIYKFIISEYRSIGIKKSKDLGYGFMVAYKPKALENLNNSTNPDSMFWNSIKYGEEDIEGFQSVDFSSQKFSSKEKEYSEKSAIYTDYSTGEKYYNEEEADDYIRTYNEATMKLKKGETIYLMFGNSVSDSTKTDKKKNKGFTCILKIK